MISPVCRQSVFRTHSRTIIVSKTSSLRSKVWSQNVRDATQAAVNTGIASLGEELSRRVVDCNDETEKLNVAMNALETRQSEALARLSRENMVKLADHHSTMQQSLDVLLLKFRNEQTRAFDSIDLQHTELRDVHLSGLAQWCIKALSWRRRSPRTELARLERCSFARSRTSSAMCCHDTRGRGGPLLVSAFH